MPKSAVRCDDGQTLSDRSIEDRIVWRILQPDIDDVNRIEASVAKVPGNPRREIRVQQEPHAGRETGTSRSFTAAAAYSRAASTSARSR